MAESKSMTGFDGGGGGCNRSPLRFLDGLRNVIARSKATWQSRLSRIVGQVCPPDKILQWRDCHPERSEGLQGREICKVMRFFVTTFLRMTKTFHTNILQKLRELKPVKNLSLLTFHPSLKTNPAFTLAEVLVTLGIIGVVAAMTIPSVVGKYKEKRTVVALKKAYSVLNNAYGRAIVDNGTPELWGWPGQNKYLSDSVKDALMPYFKDVIYCEGATDTRCFAPEEYKTLVGDIAINSYFERSSRAFWFRLTDGMTVGIFSWAVDGNCSQTCGTGHLDKSMCAYVLVDINGPEKPNRLGHDYFVFFATKYGIFPAGEQIASGHCGSIKICDINISSAQNGQGCTAWVLFKENMDYLRHQVSW